MTRIRLVVVGVVAALAATALVANASQKKSVAASADTLSWSDFSPQRPGVKVAQVSGDRFTGGWKGFVRYPPGTKAALHSHGSDLELVVVSGSFRFGDSAETEKSYGPGSYIFIPAGMPHTNSTTEDALLFEAQPGKFDTKPAAK
jgi:uncharacterized RmlC-like cupin family protein